MAANDEFDILVVREIDRLARSLAKQLIIEEELKRSGVEIAYVLGEYPDTPEGNLNKNIKAVIAEYEAMKINERTTRAIRNIVKSGSVMVHGNPPYGYKVGERDGKRILVVDEEQAEIVNLIFEWYTDPEQPISMKEMARRLTEMGVMVPGTHSTSRRWQRSTLSRILGRETYVGTWHYGKRADGKHNPEDYLIAVDVPPIVSRQTWERAQDRRQANRENAKRSTKYQYLLRRRVRCGDCRAKMTSLSKKRPNRVYLYYLCQTRKVGYHCESRCHFRADVVDAVVWSKIKSWLLDREQLLRALRARQTEEEQRLAPAKKQLGVIEDLLCKNREQLARLLDLYLGGEFPKEMLLDRRKRIEETIASLEEEQKGLTAKLQQRALTDEQVESIEDFLAKVARAFEKADESFETRRRVVEMLDVQVELESVDDAYRIYIECHAGEESVSVASSTPGAAPSGTFRPGEGTGHVCPRAGPIATTGSSDAQATGLSRDGTFLGAAASYSSEGTCHRTVTGCNGTATRP